MMFKWIPTIFLLLLLIVSAAFAQDDSCAAFVDTVLQAVGDACAEMGRNQACYGNQLVNVEPADDDSTLTFTSPGDIADLASIGSLTLGGLDTEDGVWGVALLKVQANLPETLPGQNVTMLLYGEVSLTEQGVDDAEPAGTMEAFYFTTGIGATGCTEVHTDGILVQTPQGAGEVSFTANNINIKLGSTAYMSAEPGGDFTLGVVEGEAEVTSDGTSVTVPAGTEVTVPLDEDGLADGPPSYPQPYDAEDAEALPAEGLPDPIDTAEPIAAEDVPLSYTLGGISLTTDPAQRILYPRPVGDFAAETTVTFSPDHNFQGAGIYVELDNGGRMELVLAYCESGAFDCVGRGIYFDAFSGPDFDSAIAHYVAAYRSDTVTLRIAQTGGTYSAQYRPGSGDWITIGTYDDSVVVQEIGILAQSASSTPDNPTGAPSITAVFDYFSLTRP